jgi:hypothetical protein
MSMGVPPLLALSGGFSCLLFGFAVALGTAVNVLGRSLLVPTPKFWIALAHDIEKIGAAGP